ncbi:hypothetical protein CUJ83_12930 [Methanocella sp. CWC-04]|uniref:Uncharacterized protein n=2 Tax=Methanooceanicella nereidis TaxID=2052831 RepID=A0AAP2RGT2_9EURY|nr:hypothetical protein [Methanocella sp. CWC-04]
MITNGSKEINEVFECINKVNMLNDKEYCLYYYYQDIDLYTKEAYKLWLDGLKVRTDDYISSAYDTIAACQKCKFYYPTDSKEYKQFNEETEYLRYTIKEYQKTYDSSEKIYYKYVDEDISYNQAMSDLEIIIKLLPLAASL